MVRTKAEQAVINLIEALGLDVTSEGLAETPKRVAKALTAFVQPFDPKALLKAGFGHEHAHKSGFSGMVVQSNIPFTMLCEHHFMPATGRASLGYIPSDRVVGISKLTRLVKAVGHERPSMQEIICDRVTDLLDSELRPKGVMCVISATHGCMACRGVEVSDVPTTTSAVRGVFRDVPQARQEFFELTRHSHR